jgi:hypothetical protein
MRGSQSGMRGSQPGMRVSHQGCGGVSQGCGGVIRDAGESVWDVGEPRLPPHPLCIQAPQQLVRRVVRRLCNLKQLQK